MWLLCVFNVMTFPLLDLSFSLLWITAELGREKALELVKVAEIRWFNAVGKNAIQKTAVDTATAAEPHPDHSSIDKIHKFLEENKDSKSSSFIWEADSIDLLDKRLERLTKVDAPQVSLTTTASKNYYKLGTLLWFHAVKYEIWQWRGPLIWFCHD